MGRKIINGDLKLSMPSSHLTAISSSNKFTFSNFSTEYHGIALITHNYCNTIINCANLTNNQIYKQTGTFTYDSNGSVVTTTINIRRVNDTLEIWSGNSQFQIYDGLTCYLYTLIQL